MAEKSLFYNALPDASSPTGYDRNYNADDISDWLDVVMTTGVIKSNTGLKVTPAGGLSVSVDVGKAIINGKPYRNDAAKVFTIDTAPTGSASRIDFIVLRFDRQTASRNTYLAYKKGEGAAAPALERTDLIYELALARITVAPFATEITAANIADLRGDTETVVTTTTGQSRGYCPYMTAAKGYDDYYDAIVLEYKDAVTLSAASATVEFNIPQYGWTGVDIVNVYTNGIRERESAYTISGNVITFTSGAKAAGTVVEVVVNKFIDGEGLGTALEQYKELQTIVLNLQKTDVYNYVCNGVNDNVKISQIVTEFLNAGTDYSQMTLNICGTFGASTPYAGSGTETNLYQWIRAGAGAATNRRVILDFGNCSEINLNCAAGLHYTVFYGLNVYVRNCNLIAYGEEATIYMFSTAGATFATAENCRFWITAASGFIARGGYFRNCHGSITTTNSDAFCFNTLSGGLLRVFGGEYWAYSPTANQSAVIYVNAAQAGAVVNTYSISCPTLARSGYVQTRAISCYSNDEKCSFTDTITTLEISATGQNIRGTIKASKAGFI